MVDDAPVLEHLRDGVGTHTRHERALARDAVLVELLGGDRRARGPRVYGEVEELILAKAHVLRKAYALVIEKLAPAGGAPRKGARGVEEHELRAVAVVERVLGREHALEPAVARLGRVERGAKGEHVGTGLIEESHYLGTRVGVEAVVRVEEAHVLGGSHVDAGVSRRGEPAIWLVYHPDSRVALLPAREHFARAVGRAVVHADDVDVRKRLVLERAQA